MGDLFQHFKENFIFKTNAFVLTNSVSETISINLLEHKYDLKIITCNLSKHEMGSNSWENPSIIMSGYL